MKINKVDKSKMEQENERNFKERLNFIKFWVDYIKTHKDEDWSEQQNVLINSQMRFYKNYNKKNNK